MPASHDHFPNKPLVHSKLLSQSLLLKLRKKSLDSFKILDRVDLPSKSRPYIMGFLFVCFARCNSGYPKPRGNLQKRDRVPQCCSSHLRKESGLENSGHISRNFWHVTLKYHSEMPQRQLFVSLSPQ